MPSQSFQVFQRGAYFSVEVVPDQLVVISLNTLYFYDSNKGACACYLCSPEA
jgi:endopolyphosphatase